MTDLSFQHVESIHVERPPVEVYGLVTDIARTGEWSPVCTGCEWDEGDGPAVGAYFTGTNEIHGRTWQTRSRVVVADSGREFAWEVGDGLVRWGYQVEPDGDGTKLTESWEFCAAGLQFFAEKYGDDADAQIAERTRNAHEGIPATLAAIKQVAEQQPR